VFIKWGTYWTQRAGKAVHAPTCFVLAVALLAAGCASTRSISNSGYRPRPSAERRPGSDRSDPGFDYRGELSEFDVLGVRRNQPASEEDIQQALNAAQAIRLKPQSAILLIQSGAMFPDGPMVEALSRHFRVIPFSGVPAARGGNEEDASFSRSLRLAAARAGAETILCCWGILESAQGKMATKTVTWVGVMNWFVPDERQHMRIRLKLALTDVRSGSWAVLSPPVFDSKALSWAHRRAVADQMLVERLKQRAWTSAVNELVNQYGGLASAR